MISIPLHKAQMEVKESLSKMHDLGRDAEECISLLQTAFIYNTSSPLVECRARIESIKNNEVMLTDTLAKLTRDYPEFKHYIAIPGHLARIAKNQEKIADLIEKKNSDKILFSDKAIDEVMFLLQRLVEIIRPASDIILAKNKFLSRYVEESEAGIIKRADEYATFHEERLIGGECLPVASSHFLGILEAIKSIAWHTKEITVKALQ